jgi:protein SCO1
MKTRYLIIALMFLGFASAKAQPEIGIEERLDHQIPLDLTFTDSEGKTQQLKDLIDKPVVLMLVYYNCPGICSPLLSATQGLVDKTEDLIPGKDYRILTVSFDHNETPELAAKFKKNYFTAMERKKLQPDDWKFMVGDSATVRALTDAAGFYFKPAGEKDFTHAGALIVLSPDGKVTRYLFPGNNMTFLPFNLKMSVAEASKGISSPTINKVLQFCFSYDPEGKTYVFNITKVIGSIMFLGIGIFFTVLVIKGRKKNKKERS